MNNITVQLSSETAVPMRLAAWAKLHGVAVETARQKAMAGLVPGAVRERSTYVIYPALAIIQQLQEELNGKVEGGRDGRQAWQELPCKKKGKRPRPVRPVEDDQEAS